MSVDGGENIGSVDGGRSQAASRFFGDALEGFEDFFSGVLNNRYCSTRLVQGPILSVDENLP